MHRHAIVPLADRITSSGYAYDDAGALTADPTRTYSYDGFGRLASTTVGSTTTSYTLDGAGNRLAETTGATTTSFDLDLRNSTPTILGDGSRKYLPGDPSAGYDQGGTWWSALTDLTGSAQSYVSQGGSQSAITRYDPFGAARPGSSVGTGIGFAGEWRDPAGLINLRTRAYDPVVGRFTSRDTLTGLGVAPQTANRYSYALNGPYRYADPSGHFANALYANRFAITSFILAVNPVTMVPYGLFLAVSGVDPFTGHRLSDGERFLAALPALGKVLGALSRTADVVSDASRLGKAGMAEEAGGVGSRIEGQLENLGRSTDEASMIGRQARPFVSTFQTSRGINPDAYLRSIAEHYGINLRGAGREIGISFDASLPIGTLGKTRGSPGGPMILIGPDALSAGDAQVANTIAHELRHARTYLREGSFEPEWAHGNALSIGDNTPYGSGNALQEWIEGRR